MNLYQANELPDVNGLRDAIDVQWSAETTVSIAITIIPAHLVSAEVYLLVGISGDEPVRVLFLPESGPPEVKHLRVTLNQILHRLEEAAKLVKKPDDSDEWSVVSVAGSLESRRGANSADGEEPLT